jgi:hypothetical protein
MMRINNNFLLLGRQNEFTNKLLRYFFKRLKLFLLIEYTAIEPNVILTSDKGKLNNYYGGIEGEACTAFYDEKENIILFNADKYLWGDNYVYNDTEFVANVDFGYEKFKYVIPLSDIYHELIHHIQYTYSNYEDEYTDVLEGSADIYSYILTGQRNIDYHRESLALWYLGRKVLQLDNINFYSFVANIIANSSFPQEYLLPNKKFLRYLVNDYKGDIKKFLKGFTKDFAQEADEKQFNKDLTEIHNLIFYKY